MSREAWALIKRNKNFNVHVYRRGLNLLILSLLLSCFFGGMMFYLHINKPERDYYATNGITSPVKLKAMLTANSSSQPLLEADPPNDDQQRVIPQ